MDKHYNNEYLTDTGMVLRDFKKHSYGFFENLNEGTLVDVGCGNGTDVHMMSKLFPDTVKVIGIDSDSQLISHAQNSSSTNADFIISDAKKLPFDDSSINGVRSERLVQHLIEPEKAIGEMHRVLKNNSPLVILETDWQSICYYNEHVTIGKKITDYLTEEKVNNGFSAEKLISYLRNQSFKNIEFRVFPFILTSLDEANKHLKTEIILQELLEKSKISESEFNTYTQTLKEYDQLGYFSCSINMVAVSATK